MNTRIQLHFTHGEVGGTSAHASSIWRVNGDNYCRSALVMMDVVSATANLCNYEAMRRHYTLATAIQRTTWAG